MKRILLFLCTGMFIMSSVLAQPWMKHVSQTENKSQSDISFYEIQAAFNEYWKDREIEKGKGYKQFRRWEYFMEPRVYPSGKIGNPEYQKSFWEKINSKSINKASPVWVSLGPSNTPYTINTTNKTGNGRINCIAFHPSDQDILFAGAPSGGFWLSEDGGNTWRTTTDQLSSIGVSDIVVDYTDPDIIYIATGDGDAIDTYGIGIARSTNGGESWQPTSLSLDVVDYTYFRRILMSPVNHSIMLSTSNRGIYKTTNGWNSHTLLISGNFRDIEFHPTKSLTVYATTYSSMGTARIFRSTDGGTDFSISMNGINLSDQYNRIEIAVTPDEPNSVFALFSDDADNGFYALYKSIDEGITWELLYGQGIGNKNLLGWSDNGSDQGGQGWYDLSLSVSPSNADVIIVGGVNLWKSTDGGNSWNLSGLWYPSVNYNYVHADHHMLVYSPLNGNLYCGNDGGIYTSTNHGESWTDISDGLEILQSYKIGVSQGESNMLLSGNQDNGTFLLKNGTWHEVIGGDGMECIVDPLDANVLYGSVYYGNIYKSVDGGLTFSPVKPSPDLEGAWVTPYVMSKAYNKMLLTGYDQIYKTVDGSSSWEVISDFAGQDLKVIRIASSNENYIYASNWNNIWKTSDGGKNWTEIGANLPVVTITDIAISDTDPNKIWISVSGYDENEKVFYSSNGGKNWINFSYGLPNVPANSIIYQAETNHQLYLGTDIGIYARNVKMNQWEDFSGNLPNVIVTELEIQENENILFAGTYGRGIWKLALTDTFPVSPTAIDVNITEACLNADVMYTLKSNSNDFDSIRWNFGPDATPTDVTNDTVYVSYSSPGLKNVTITTYSGGTPLTEIYSEFLKVSDNIEFEVLPNKLFNCSSDSAEIFVTGNYSLSFYPPDMAYQTSENTVNVYLQSDMLTITATHGTCTDVYDLEIINTPDDICEAQRIYFGENGPFSNQCGTPQENEPVPPEGFGSSGGCFSQAGWCQGEARIDNSVWFKFFIEENYPGISIETEGFDNQIAVYKANSCQDILNGNYTLLAANDDYVGNLDYAATIPSLIGYETGDTLWLQVDGSYGGVTGIFSITLNDFRLSNIEDEPYIADVSNIQIYPNPNNGNFIIEINGPVDDQVYIDIISVSGNIIFSKEFNNVQSPIFTDINLDDAHRGIYLVRITTNNSVITRKIMIQ